MQSVCGPCEQVDVNVIHRGKPIRQRVNSAIYVI